MKDATGYPTGRALLETARAVLDPMSGIATQDANDLQLRGMQELIGMTMAGGASMRRRNAMVRDNPVMQKILARMTDAQIDEYMTELTRIATRAATHRMWAKTKNVYAIHPLLLRHLSAGSVERGLPVSILDRLTRPNPYLLLPGEPPPPKVLKALAGSKRVNPLVGVYITGKFDDGTRMCDTHDERRDALMLTFTNVAPDRPDTIDLLRATVPLHGTFSVDDAVSETLGRFRFNDNELGEQFADGLRMWLTWAVRQVLLSLLYICTDEADVVEYRRAPAASNKRGKRTPKPESSGEGLRAVQETGYRLGPALHAARIRYEQQAKESTGTGRAQPAHYRGPSPSALYWTGPGGTVPVFRERRGYWVHEEQLHDGTQADTVTVIPVR